jgi:hypothetical protein
MTRIEAALHQHPIRVILARILIGAVLLMNLQAAAAFLLWPGRFIGSFELTGVVGEAALRGMAVLFLMWNVPYAVAFWNPLRYRISLYEAIAMQTIGLVGETIIFLTLPDIHIQARAAIWRFIIFDGVGLLVLIAAALLSKSKKSQGNG